MRSFVSSLLCIGVIILVITPVRVPGETDLSVPMGIVETPEEIFRIWLRFHEIDLCQEIDAVFVFNKNGMEVWSRIDDEKSYRKFKEMLEPLRSKYRIELYATQPLEDEDSKDNWNPPSSLWENSELRSSLGDPLSEYRQSLGFEGMNDLTFYSANQMLKQRLLVYADQILERNLKIKRYAADLPALANLTVGSALSPEMRLKAGLICQQHARELEKELGKLEKSLKYAFPRSGGNDDSSFAPIQSGSPETVLANAAIQIALTTQSVAERVDNFIHPKQHTVDLDELRRPSILYDMERLQEMVSDFQEMPVKAALSEP
jgi:hypothetical protein